MFQTSKGVIVLPGPEKKHKPTLLERAAAAMDLPGDVAAGLPKIEIIGSRQFSLCNHKGLLEYSETCIDINGGRVIIRVNGQDMAIKMMSARELLIEGELFGIEFIY
jgi:sporulation protein YqfC